MAIKKIPPVHPGEILLEDYLKPTGVSQTQLALNMRVSPGRINEIILGKRSITPETALRLSKAIGTTPEFWLNLQAAYDLRELEDRMGSIIEKEVIPITLTS
jgi:antitoxin HigA-1